MSTQRILEDVERHLSDGFIRSEAVVVEAALPEPSPRIVTPSIRCRTAFEETDKLDDVGVLSKEMGVVGHETPRVQLGLSLVGCAVEQLYDRIAELGMQGEPWVSARRC